MQLKPPPCNTFFGTLKHRAIEQCSTKQVLVDREQLDIEDQLGVARDPGDVLLAVAHMRRDGHPALTTGSHASDANFHTLDDFTLSEFETERLSLLVG